MGRFALGIRWFMFLTGIVLILAACNPTAPEASQIASSDGIRVWLDQPPDEANLPLAPYTLRAHARDSIGGGVQQIAFLVNEIPLGTIPTDPTKPLVAAEFAWNPSMPGEYTIQAQATGSSGTALSGIAVICVGPNCAQAITPTPTTAALQPAGCKGTPVIASFSAAPTSIAAGGSSALSWSVSNADRVEISTIFEVPPTGTRNVSPATTTTYMLIAYCGGKENNVQQSVTVTVTGGKGCAGIPVVSFTASPTSITAGASSTLRWTITNADQVIMSDGSAVGLTGSRVVSPRTTTTYGIAALCGGKENLVERSVTVNVAAAPGPTRTPTRTPTPVVGQPPPPQPPPPPQGCSGTPNISSFTISSEVIQPGGSVTLNWGAVANADSVSIDQGIGGVGTPGSVTVTPGGPTTYTLTARCGNSVATRQVKMTISSPPPPPPKDTSPPNISLKDSGPVYYITGCGNNTLTIYATVSDPAGISSVSLSYHYIGPKGDVGGWINAGMNPEGGNNYRTDINPGNDAYKLLGGQSGQIEYSVTAQDNAGNSNKNGASVSIQFCPG